MAILYVETNSVLAFAKGQDREAGRLLDIPPDGSRLAIPSVCFMEALKVLASERRELNRFHEQLDQTLREASRDLTSPHARDLYAHLYQAKSSGRGRLNDIESRLFQALNLLEAKAETIELGAGILGRSLAETRIEDHADNLILHCILGHAGQSPGEPKALLSANSRDFGQDVVRQALADVGVAKYFTRAQDALGWLTARGPTGNDPSSPA